MNIKPVIIACILLNAGTLILGLPSYANAENIALRVEDDIPMGILGYKLGTYLTIEGIRTEKGKVGVRALMVNKINDKMIDTPISLWIDNIESLPKGERIIVRGYESGKMIGLPDEVIEKENLEQPQARWQFFRYFIVTSVVEPIDLKVMSYSPRVTSPAAGSQDLIDQLTTELSSNPLWMNGAYPSIKLSERAKHDEVITTCFKLTGFDQGHIKDYKIIKIKKVKIRGRLPEDYFAALIDTDLGKKIVLFQYVNPSTGWWTRVYDLK